MSVLQVVLQQLGGPRPWHDNPTTRGSPAKAAAIKGSMTSAIEGGRPGRGASSRRALSSRSSRRRKRLRHRTKKLGRGG